MWWEKELNGACGEVVVVVGCVCGDCCRSRYSACIMCRKASSGLSDSVRHPAASCHAECFMSCGSLKPFGRVLQVMVARGKLITCFVGCSAQVMKSCRQRTWHGGSWHQNSTVPAVDRPCLQGWSSSGPCRSARAEVKDECGDGKWEQRAIVVLVNV